MSAEIERCELPAAALLRRYLNEGAYTDCFVTQVDRPVEQHEYIEAFYTSRLFRLERWVLAALVNKPSTDEQVRALARGEANAFAAWSVEGRAADQLLLCDFQGRTRSWLMSSRAPGGQTTRLYFGSAVVPVTDRKTGQTKMGLTYRALLGFHQAYSRQLLSAAARRAGIKAA